MKKNNYSQLICRIKIPLSLILFWIFFIAFEANLIAQFSVTGPTLICTSGQYTVQNYGNETLVWSSTSNLTLTSTQGQNPATFAANGSGNGTITATITCCGSSTPYLIYVWVGPPEIGYVAAEGKYPEQHLYDCSFWPAPYDISDPEYSLEVDYPGEVWVCEDGWADVYLPGDPAGYSFLLTSTNTCGSDYLVFYFEEIWYDKKDD